MLGRRRTRGADSKQWVTGLEVPLDPLTSLPDRRAFEFRVHGETQRVRTRGGKLAICLLDLDRLRDVNTALGWAVGDEVLRSISRNLAEISQDGAVFRVGEDEFGIVFAGLGPDGARAAMRTFARAARDDAGCRRIGLSWGVAATGGRDAAALMASAAAELKRFKRSRARLPLPRLQPAAAPA
jgi:diguanylate cyclase (GGDEF)-like protein